MRWFFCFLTGCLLFPFNMITAQIIWSFDGNVPLLSDNGQISLNLHTVKEIPEFVTGIEGKALRTDGYSTWLEGDIANSFSSISGWFALESYPTDTAAFIGAKDKMGNSIALCTDRFGELSVGVGEKKSFSYYSLGVKVDRFKWLHLLLDIHKGAIYLNGQKLSENSHWKLLSSDRLKINIGRDFRQKKVGIYNVTSINGLIDDLKVDYNLVDQKSLRKRVSALIGKLPVLAIPKTRFANDFNRPHYHLLPAANWTNETHGFIYYRGKYHIFNQKNASNIFLGQINWGHFTSSDLIHWVEEKPALIPDKPYDKNGIWSGCAVINNSGIPQIIYTSGGDKNGICTAFPKDSSLIEWEKYGGNPVITTPPAMYTRTDMRDEYAWKEGNTWYMIVGYGIEQPNEPHGALLLYKSQDLKKWDFIHLLFEGNPKVDSTGVFWEMPVLKKMNDKYVLLINRVPHDRVPARCQYWIGNFKNEKFIPDNPIPQNLEVINRLLSPSVMETSDGVVVSIAIIPDEIGSKATYKQGWAHLYSIPRVWKLEHGKICQSPHPALQQLRDKHLVFSKRILSPANSYILSKSGHQLEIQATFYPADANLFGFKLLKNPDNSEYSMIYYDVRKQELIIDQTHSSQRKYIPLNIRKDHYQMDLSKPVNIHLFIDGSVVEGFINNEDAFTTRIFPLKRNSTQLELFSDGKTSEASAEVWTLKDAKVKMNF